VIDNSMRRGRGEEAEAIYPSVCIVEFLIVLALSLGMELLYTGGRRGEGA